MKTIRRRTSATRQTTPPADLTATHLLELVLASLDADQAEGVVTIELTGKSSICDHMVIASGRSARQVTAMAEHLREQLKAALRRTPGVEGLRQADWVLVDAGDVVVHLFRPEVRSFYNLEKMWGAHLPDSLGLPEAPGLIARAP
ncbi:MAG: ribosome silencing factor [Alphaproteobacteria bacterium]|nr:ribosome silencing factor [Alphaproteobacteria bacterium]